MRKNTAVPYRICGLVVLGHSQTGEIDKIDGPYYFCRALKKLRQSLPQWMPVVGIEGGRVNMVPVDYVVDAMDHIAHKAGLDGGCFHLTDPAPCRIGEVLLHLRAGHAPEMTMRLDAVRIHPSMVKYAGGMPRSSAPPCRAARPRHTRRAIRMVNYPARFVRTPNRFARHAHPRADLRTYAWRLWDSWGATSPGSVREHS